MGNPEVKNTTPKVEIKVEAGDQLTEEEREIIEDLTLQENESEVEVMIFTREELKKFRSLLDDDPRNNEALKSFIEKQKAETVSTSEVMEGSKVVEKMGGIEKFKDLSDLFDETIYKHFFKNNNSVFSGLDISEDAKRNFSTGANFFFINYLAQEFEKSGSTEELGKTTDKEEGFLDSLNSLGNLGEKIEKGFDLVKDLFTGDLGETLKKVYNPEKEALLKKVFTELNIKDYEEEAIFMNPLEAHNFMDFVYNGNPTKDQIKDYINERKNNGQVKFSPENKVALKNIGDKVSTLITPEIGGALSKFSKIKKDLTKISDGIKEAIVNNKSVSETLTLLTAIPFVGDFIKTLLEMIGITDLDKLLSGKDFEASKKTISENIAGKGSVFEGKKIGEDFMQVNGNNDTVFLSDINYLVGEKKGEDFGKEIKKVFKNGGDFDNFIKNEKVNIKFEGDTINYEKLKKSVSLFVEYKKAKEKDKSLTVEGFMEKKEKEKKANQDTINQALALTAAGSGVQQASSTEKPTAPETQTETPKTSTNNQATPIEESTQKQPPSKKENTGTKDTSKTEKTQPNQTSTDKTETQASETRKSQNKQEAKPTSKNTTETTTKKPNPELFINEAEGLEINGNNITAVFEVNGAKYKLQLLQGKSDTGNLIVTGGGEIKVFEGGADIILYLSNNFGDKLNEVANGKYFGKADWELTGHTVKDILMNGLNEKVGFKNPFTGNIIGEQINEPGLKQLFAENFFASRKLKDSATMTISKTDYTFTKVA